MRSGRPTAVIAVKNGIGLGHVRRATLVAQSLLQRGRVGPVIVSQAGSTALYAGSGLRVLNLPRLNRVSSVLVEDACLAILDEVAGRIAPSVVVEDTYPDPRLREIDSLRGVPRVLVTRRLDAATLEQMIEEGAFAGLDRIAYCQTLEEFKSERHSPSIERAMKLSGIVRFVGPIWRRASPEERVRARARFARAGQRLVVVALGGGGDKYLDAFMRRMLDGVISAGITVGGMGRTWSMVIATGPYSSGAVPSIAGTPGITVVGFEPDLPALLAAADVVVLKPGSNSLLESLDGNANLVLVPDRSYREGLPEYSARLARTRGLVVSAPETGPMAEALADALSSNAPRRPRSEPSAGAVAAIVEQAATIPQDTRVGVPLGLVRTDGGLPGDRLRSLALPDERIESMTDWRGGLESKNLVWYVDDVPSADVDLQIAFDMPGSIFVAPQGPQGRKVASWLRNRGLDPRLHLAFVEVFRVRDGCRERLTWWMRRTLTENPRAALLFLIDPECSNWAHEVADIPLNLTSMGTSWTPLSTLSQRLAQRFVRGEDG